MARNALAALARNVVTDATYGTLRSDMARGEEGSISDDDVVKYLDFFRSMYLIEEIPGWDVGIRSKKHLRTKPKRYFVAFTSSPGELTESCVRPPWTRHHAPRRRRLPVIPCLPVGVRVLAAP